MNWFDSLQAFKTIAQHHSFSAGARKLGMPPSKVTTLIQQLEKALNTVLFVRTTRRLSLTEEGQTFFTRISPLLEEWEIIHTTFLDKTTTLRGTLTIGSAPDIFSVSPFPKILSDFLQQHTEVTAILKTFNKPLSLIDESLDVFVGIDYYIRDTANTLSRTLLQFNATCYASPKYVKRFGEPKNLNELSKHHCIVFVDRNVWSFKKEKIKLNGCLHVDDGMSLFSAACEGVGIIRAPDFMAKNYVDKKLLVPLLEKSANEPSILKVYYPQLTYQPRKVKEFISFLIDRAKMFEK